MMPGTGFDVVAVEDGHYFVARTTDETVSWCLTWSRSISTVAG
jgi:hypothetical protein